MARRQWESTYKEDWRDTMNQDRKFSNLNEYKAFRQGVSNPDTHDKLAYVVACCLYLDADMPMFHLNATLGHVHSLEHKTLMATMRDHYEELEMCHEIQGDDLKVQVDYFRVLANRMELPVSPDRFQLYSKRIEAFKKSKPKPNELPPVPALDTENRARITAVLAAGFTGNPPADRALELKRLAKSRVKIDKLSAKASSIRDKYIHL